MKVRELLKKLESVDKNKNILFSTHHYGLNLESIKQNSNEVNFLFY